MTRGQVLTTIANSQEATNLKNGKSVADLFSFCLGRAASQTDINAWSVQTKAFQVSGICTSPEAMAYNRRFIVQEVYRQVLHREPDANGWTAWTNDTSWTTYDQLANKFSQFPEAKGLSVTAEQLGFFDQTAAVINSVGAFIVNLF